jgi:hypothetical protein
MTFQLKSQSPLRQEKKDLWKTDKKAYIDSTLVANNKLDFVKRLYNTKKDIATPEGEGKPGDRSTHLMSYDPGSKRVYPKVVNQNNKLTYKTGDDAYNYADKTKEYIEFPTAEKAAWFSSNYKGGTGVLKKSKSPLQKQKLSPKAAKAKAARDLAYAKTDDRTAKKAHAQRMHRKSPGKKGMDYDHEDGRFESVKQNRGNEGEGTKKESGKNYKVK